MNIVITEGHTGKAEHMFWKRYFSDLPSDNVMAAEGCRNLITQLSNLTLTSSDTLYVAFDNICRYSLQVLEFLLNLVGRTGCTVYASTYLSFESIFFSYSDFLSIAKAFGPTDELDLVKAMHCAILIKDRPTLHSVLLQYQDLCGINLTTDEKIIAHALNYYTGYNRFKYFSVTKQHYGMCWDYCRLVEETVPSRICLYPDCCSLCHLPRSNTKYLSNLQELFHKISFPLVSQSAQPDSQLTTHSFI